MIRTIGRPLRLSSIFLNGRRSISYTKALSSDDIPSHFRASAIPHPLLAKPEKTMTFVHDESAAGDHTGLQQNHIYTQEELKECISDQPRHKPVTLMDHIMNKVMYGLYHTFNFVTGYSPVNPTVKAMQWRLIVLESVAGVPGFVAAGFRHFKSLRTMKRDYGWIPTLLEEAENERMHLLVCLRMFEASYITRTMVVAGQMVMTPLLMAVYLVNPKAMHRFVGYLEETAVHTYINVISHAETPDTNLHNAWSKLPAPALAKGYWKLSDDATWVDTLKCMCADEAHHRDVNHTFAGMKSDDPNPYLEHHKTNASRAWRIQEVSPKQ